MRQKSSTKKKYRCWVLKWKWNGDHRRPNVDFCHLLPYQWSNDRVRGYVKALYANFQCDNHPSALALLKNTKFWNVRLRDDGTLIRTGTNPFLEAHKVIDLTVEYDRDKMKEILRWTPVGEPRQESYERILPFLPTHD